MLEDIVNSGLKFLRKAAIGAVLTAGVLSAVNCHRIKKWIDPEKKTHASVSEEKYDPNPPDDSFMDGAILPPDISYALAPVDYVDADGNAYSTEAVSGQAIVIFDSLKSTDAGNTSSITSYGGTVISKVPNAGLYLASVAPGSETSFVTSMRTQPNVLSAGLNAQAVELTGYSPLEMSSWSGSEQEYLKQINAFEGWNLVETTLKDRFSDNDITLSVIDMDFDSIDIIDFSKRVDDISERAQIIDSVPLYSSLHGFDVATLAAATGDNANKPVGIDWYSSLRLRTVKHRDWGKYGRLTAFDLNVLLAQEIGEAGADVVNLSLAFGKGPNFNNSAYDINEEHIFKESFRNFKNLISNVAQKYPEKKFLAVVAAGNDDVQMDWSELKDDNMLVVGACNSALIKAPYSNHGSFVDIFVPGTNLDGDFPVFKSFGLTEYEPGTSFAAPIASGLASLLFNADPSLTGKQVKEMIVTNSKKISDTMRVLDMYGALSKIAPPPVVTPTWAKTYGTGTLSEFESIDQLLDGGYIAAGTRGLVLQLNPDGTIAWKRRYSDGVSNENIHSIIKTNDGGYLFAGERTTGAFGSDFWIVKLSSDGSIAWQKGTGSSSNDVAYGAFETFDGGGYLIVGVTGILGYTNGDVGLIKLNSDGSVGWRKSYHDNIDNPYATRRTSDGGFVVAGAMGSTEDGFVMKCASDGTIEWQKKYGNAGLQDIFFSIEQTSDGGYIAAGKTSSALVGGAEYQGWVVKLDTTGSIQWQKAYSLPDDTWGYDSGYIEKVRQTSDGGYSAVGLFGSGSRAILNLDKDGNVAWQKQYLAPNGILKDIRQTNEGGYVVCGRREAITGTPPIDAWVLKINADGSCAPLDALVSLSIKDTAATATDTTFTPSALLDPPYDTSAVATDPSITVTQQAP